MALVGPVSQLTDEQAARVLAFAERAGRDVGHTPLGDDEWRQLVGLATAPPPPPTAPPAPAGVLGMVAAAWAEDEAGGLRGYAQAVRLTSEPSWTAEVFVAGSGAAPASLADLGAPLLGR